MLKYHMNCLLKFSPIIWWIFFPFSTRLTSHSEKRGLPNITLNYERPTSLIMNGKLNIGLIRSMSLWPSWLKLSSILTWMFIIVVLSNIHESMIATICTCTVSSSFSDIPSIHNLWHDRKVPLTENQGAFKDIMWTYHEASESVVALHRTWHWHTFFWRWELSVN